MLCDVFAIRLRRPSRTEIIAAVALFVVLGGTAGAAGRYLITSTSQIKPSVLKALRGDAGHIGPAGSRGIGATGAPGSPGPSGPSGEPGATGAQGPAGATGPAGPAGPAGPSGAPIVDRIRTEAPAMTLGHFWTTAPTSGWYWAQSSQELQQLVGQISLTNPSYNTCSVHREGKGEEDAYGTVHIELANSTAGPWVLAGWASGQTPDLAPGGETRIYPIHWGGQEFESQELDVLTLYEPSSEVGHFIKAEVSDNCGEGQGAKTGHFTVNSITIDVTGAR
jgi:hypothetical protein